MGNVVRSVARLDLLEQQKSAPVVVAGVVGNETAKPPRQIPFSDNIGEGQREVIASMDAVLLAESNQALLENAVAVNIMGRYAHYRRPVGRRPQVKREMDLRDRCLEVFADDSPFGIKNSIKARSQ
ncbi:hypothetical protein CMUS01_16679 [Colletotrichum musicola]|uniref:Uncharacterized protein n=1 Tax=Colletotrichum musicola TaxID=2175873 RepID=A0A8H6MID3_9PEZI|nr:hypothetical protein CMUS01_16679 [Colletotrichum musicola]